MISLEENFQNFKKTKITENFDKQIMSIYAGKMLKYAKHIHDICEKIFLRDFNYNILRHVVLQKYI